MLSLAECTLTLCKAATKGKVSKHIDVDAKELKKKVIPKEFTKWKKNEIKRPLKWFTKQYGLSVQNIRSMNNCKTATLTKHTMECNALFEE